MRRLRFLYPLSFSTCLLFSFMHPPTIKAADCAGTQVVSSCTQEHLRAAIGEGGWISLCCDGTIALTNTIQIEHDVVLDATGHKVTISGGDAVRLFKVNPGVSFSVTNVVLAAGKHDGVVPGEAGHGAAILNEGGTVLLVGAALINNRVAGYGGLPEPPGFGSGGAIFSRGGALTLIGSTVSNNFALGGWMEMPLPGADSMGGGIYTTNTTVMILNSTLVNNRCEVYEGGSFFSQTGATARGGAMYHHSGSLFISNATWIGNVAVGKDASFANLSSPGNACGGAIALNEGEIVIERTSFLGNTAQGGLGFRHSGIGRSRGGAVWNRASVLLRDTTLATNLAFCRGGSDMVTDMYGGAIYNEGSVTMNGCSIYWNAVQGAAAAVVGFSPPGVPGGGAFGGGVFNAGQLATTNCSIFGNVANGGDPSVPTQATAGVPGNGIGGGVYNASNGVFSAMNLTIASNVVRTGRVWVSPGVAAGANIGNEEFGTVVLRNTLLATGTNGNAWGPIIDSGHNLSSDATPTFDSGSSVNGVDPLLAPPADNGGPTLTLALREGSPAVDAGTLEGAPAIDQRGATRPFGPAPDIGAYEATPPQLPRLVCWRDLENFMIAFNLPAGMSCQLQYRAPEQSTWTDLEMFNPSSEPRDVMRSYPLSDATCRFFRLYSP